MVVRRKVRAVGRSITVREHANSPSPEFPLSWQVCIKSSPACLGLFLPRVSTFLCEDFPQTTRLCISANMPRVKKKRGRFNEAKERKAAANSDAGHERKRRKLDHGDTAQVEADPEVDQDAPLYFEDTVPSVIPAAEAETTQQPDEGEIVFYGLLDEDEQTYYANVNSKLVADDFEDAEEKSAFVEAVYRESKGKELKLASSQSCSRHLERLIAVSTQVQLRSFFVAISEGLTQLAQHRFGSHVCETLFKESAKYVPAKQADDAVADEERPSITELFLGAASLLEPNIGHMLTDKFASHTLRALLLVLSGEPLTETTAKKEKHENEAQDKPAIAPRKVPKTLLEAAAKLKEAAVSSLDTTYLRALATHPTGNPVLQLLLRLELAHSDKGRKLDENSIFHRLVAPDTLESTDSEGAKFISGLTFDATGSRLVEVLVEHSPGKIFKKLYKGIWKEKIATMAKNDIASYVAMRILIRLGKDELLEARDAMLPELPALLRRRRFALLRTLVERSQVRMVDCNPLTTAIQALQKDSQYSLVQRLLYPLDPTADAKDSSKERRADVHGSLLAQAMLEVDQLGDCIRRPLSTMSIEDLLKLAKDPTASRMVQFSLTTSATPMPYRRQMVPKFYGHVTELALDSAGSYMVEALWEATNGIHFMKERVAGELAANEPQLRDSFFGRKVWRFWSMDLYSRRRGEWQAVAKGINADQEGAAKKSPIELARLRRAEEKAKKLQSEAASVAPTVGA
jgi:nucleolar protein 9